MISRIKPPIQKMDESGVFAVHLPQGGANAVKKMKS
jgi:hypothetical protein